MIGILTLILSFVTPVMHVNRRTIPVIIPVMVVNSNDSYISRQNLLKDVGAFVGGGLLAEGVNFVGKTIDERNHNRVIDQSLELMN